MSQIIINGTVINTTGNSKIVISNGRITVDGNDVSTDAKQINIKVEGNIGQLSVDMCQFVQVKGDVGNVKTVSGNVEVTGNVVSGDVATVSGSVQCGSVAGVVRTVSGNVTHRSGR